ncbi:hypothetical protein RIF29_10325 [Crotalaria pallida]|uniref:Uncharacterized protein n=1 Tax=Crotalaria pallida TaxID=3830 RepID=A0AAN9IK06_CROPI
MGSTFCTCKKLCTFSCKQLSVEHFLFSSYMFVVGTCTFCDLWCEIRPGSSIGLANSPLFDLHNHYLYVKHSSGSSILNVLFIKHAS